MLQEWKQCILQLLWVFKLTLSGEDIQRVSKILRSSSVFPGVSLESSELAMMYIYLFFHFFYTKAESSFSELLESSEPFKIKLQLTVWHVYVFILCILFFYLQKFKRTCWRGMCKSVGLAPVECQHARLKVALKTPLQYLHKNCCCL